MFGMRRSAAVLVSCSKLTSPVSAGLMVYLTDQINHYLLNEYHAVIKKSGYQQKTHVY